MNILILGGAGFLGSVLVGKLLQYGHKVVVVDNLMYGQSSLLQYCNNPNFKFVWGDVNENEFVDDYITDCDVFIPLASIVGAPACSRFPQSGLVDKSITRYRLRNKMVVFPMSNSGYGTQSGELYCTEETPLTPVSRYGLQKVEVENWLFKHHPNTISLRLATVFGVSPRMRTDLLVNFTVNECVNKKVILLPEDVMNNNRNFVHIQDVADCFIHCINNFDNMKGQPYNLGNDSLNMTLGEMTYQIAENLGSEVVLSHHYKDPDKRNYIVSNEKLRKVGFEAKRNINDEIPNLVKACSMIQMMNYGRTEFRNA